MSAIFTPPRIGLGCMGMASCYGQPASQDTVNHLVNQAIKLGCTHFDTAELYRSTDMDEAPDTIYNEKQLGEALKGALLFST